VSSRISEIAPRLEKLVLMLSSDQPGEVVAAAAAIRRTLETVGADWHDLTRELTKPVAPSHDRSRGENYDSDRSGWRPLHAYCRRHLDALSAREQDFIATLDTWRGNVTEKQLAWLIAIHGRLRRQETS
jgi:hypothetical protein